MPNRSFPRSAVCSCLIVCFSFFSLNANPIPAAQPEKTHSIMPYLIIGTVVVTIAGYLVSYFVHKPRAKDVSRIQAEQIDIRVAADNTVSVQGTYALENPPVSANRMRIFYPIPDRNGSLVSARLGPVAPRSVTRAERAGYYGFDLVFEAANSTNAGLVVEYSCPAAGNENCYILQSTKFWGQPIEKGLYTIELPAGKNLTRCSYDYQASQATPGHVRYEISKSDFMPSQDLVFAWE
jgi:hypothetical protein